MQVQLEEQIQNKTSATSRSRLVDRYSMGCRDNSGVDFPVSFCSLAGFLCMLVIARKGVRGGVVVGFR